MAAASVTNTFTATTAAVASEVNRNFDDLVDFANDSTTHRDGSKPFTGEVSMGSFKITNVASGSAANDAATVGQLAGTLPTGFMVMYAAAVSPSVSWIVCDGAAISRSSYSDLFAVIGISFGVGDGATTFNVPNLQNRFPYGGTVGTAGGSNDAVTIAHDHTFSGSTNSDSHSHSEISKVSESIIEAAPGTGGVSEIVASSVDLSLTTGSDSHSHSVSGTTVSAGVSGIGLNRPAFVGVQFLIKSGL
jgi:microcystin-dependent protein